MVQVIKFTPEEKEFFDMISEEHDVTIKPSITSSDGIQTIMITMRRCINNEHVVLSRMIFNYYRYHEIIPKQLSLKNIMTLYVKICIMK